MDRQRRLDELNALITAMGLADEYGDRGGLIADYAKETDDFVLQDEAYAEHFPLDVDDQTLRTYLQTFLDDQARD